jgi:hypothetical protein
LYYRKQFKDVKGSIKYCESKKIKTTQCQKKPDQRIQQWSTKHYTENEQQRKPTQNQDSDAPEEKEVPAPLVSLAMSLMVNNQVISHE